MTIRRLALLAFLAALAGAPLSPARAAAGDDGFKVIVHADHPEARIPRAVLSSVFMKRMTRWSDGRTVVPVEPADAKLRERFGARVHGRKLAQIDAYWDHQVFTGREVPPGRKATDEEIIAFVRRTPGAIGYVAAGTTVPDGVKLVSVH